MKSLNPNPLNKKNQNGRWNPFFSRSKDVTQNGFDWFCEDYPETSISKVEVKTEYF